MSSKCPRRRRPKDRSKDEDRPPKGKKVRIPFRIGNWLPKPEVEKRWIEELIKRAEKDDLPYHPVIQAFQDFVERNPTMHMQYSQMFTDVTHSETPTGDPQVKDYYEMFTLVNEILLTYAPEYSTSGLVGFPINAILNWSMGTTYGYAAFLNEEANEHWMKVLNQWGEFLKSPASTYVLVDDQEWGWFSEDALAAMPGFAETFVCDPTQEHWGYKSWDDFFVREFQEGTRPIAKGDYVISSACESHPYDLQDDVQQRDEFWIKEQYYSVDHMLAGDPLASQFYGGTVYQAFLSALSYHRWHSPVDGTVVKAYNVPGSYYAATLEVGEDPASPNKSQGYICQVAARAVIFIEADNPAIGLLGFVAVGMAEVSTCEIKTSLIPTDGNRTPRVRKGDEIGMFHFGGSTYCLLFRPGVELEWDPKVLYLLKHPQDGENILLNSKLATVVKP